MIKIIINDEQITAKEIEELLAKVELAEDKDTFYCNVRTRGKEREAIKHSTFITARLDVYDKVCPICQGRGIVQKCVGCKNGTISNLFSNKLVGLVRIIGDSTYEYYISEVMVLPEYQGRGIGTKLMKASLDYCKQNGFMKIFLTAAPGRESYYEKFGFEKTKYTVMRILNQKLER